MKIMFVIEMTRFEQHPLRNFTDMVIISSALGIEGPLDEAASDDAPLEG